MHCPRVHSTSLGRHQLVPTHRFFASCSVQQHHWYQPEQLPSSLFNLTVLGPLARCLSQKATAKHWRNRHRKKWGISSMWALSLRTTLPNSLHLAIHTNLKVTRWGLNVKLHLVTVCESSSLLVGLRLSAPGEMGIRTNTVYPRNVVSWSLAQLFRTLNAPRRQHCPQRCPTCPHRFAGQIPPTVKLHWHWYR